MPSELENQVDELQRAGYPVKKGTRTMIPSDPENISEVTTANWIHRWALHAAQNYPTVSRAMGVKSLQRCATGIPAFCVGIGPSLDSSIADLKLARGRALIIATDAAFRPLLANGIVPQIVLNFDCGEHQETLFRGIQPDMMANTLLVANSCTHPKTIAAWRGPIMFYNQWHQQDDFVRILLPYIYPKLGILYSLGTVGNVLLLLAHYLRCAPIFSLGMDLCYKMGDGGWKYRCQDYEFSEIAGDNEWKPTENKLLYDNDYRVSRSSDETINGNVYRTDPELKLYRESLVNFLKGIKMEIIDCSEGVLKEFLKTMDVVSAIQLHCKDELSHFQSVLLHPRELYGQNSFSSTGGQSFNSTRPLVEANFIVSKEEKS